VNGSSTARPGLRANCFVLYRRSPERRGALAAPPGAPVRYLLFGFDTFGRRGWRVLHNLGDLPRARGASLASRWLNGFLDRHGAGGDFETVWQHRRLLSASDVVVGTSDSVGLPAAWLARAGFWRAPFVYVSIGLPERLARASPGMRARMLDALRPVTRFVAYGHEEASLIREAVGEGPGSPRVAFVPFGVDADLYKPGPGPAPDVDVLCVGADPQRDFALLGEMLRRRPGWSARVITTPERASERGRLPPSAEVRTGVGLEGLRSELARARVVVLPVRENSYSGATTTLLQALAMERPVAVSRVGAIRDGYGLADREHVRWAEPGDAASLETAVSDLLAAPEEAAAMGRRARQLVLGSLTWAHFADRMASAVAGAVAGAEGVA
jgi:glycosyltransferase involved in cell wall biosynthesis